jgi:hypothetical protein
MKITIDKDLVELTPENEHETTNLETLWRLVIDCAGFNKKLEPVGEYIPQKNTCARFVIEGLQTNTAQAVPEARADQDCTCYCQQCNKYCNLKKNDIIPMCCGKLMEILD